KRKLRIERVDFEEVTMRAAWRAGTAVANLLKVVGALHAAAWKCFSRRRVLDQTNLVSRQIVEHPMHPGARRRVGIVANDRERLCRLWHAGPLQRRRDVDAIASVLLWNRFAFLECSTGCVKSHFFLLRCGRGLLFNWLGRAGASEEEGSDE